MNGSRMSRLTARAAVRHGGIALAGLAVLTLTAACGVAAASPHRGDASLVPSARQVSRSTPPYATRARARRVARGWLAKAVLPPGTRAYSGKRVPDRLRHPIDTSAGVDVHSIFTANRSMRKVIAFLDRHHPKGMRHNGSIATYSLRHGRKLRLERAVIYSPRHLNWGFSEISMLAQVIAGPHGHAWLRVDVRVVWYPRRSPAEHLVAGRFKAVTISVFFYRPRSWHARRTFTQRAIIGKLTRALNSLPALPGVTLSCYLPQETYTLRFKPVSGHPAATVRATVCGWYAITVGGRKQPYLTGSNRIDKIVNRLVAKGR